MNNLTQRINTINGIWVHVHQFSSYEKSFKILLQLKNICSMSNDNWHRKITERFHRKIQNKQKTENSTWRIQLTFKLSRGSFTIYLTDRNNLTKYLWDASNWAVFRKKKKHSVCIHFRKLFIGIFIAWKRLPSTTTLRSIEFQRFDEIL